ncbi:tetratricopeptide repeat protein [Rheinheimera soli]|uniref:Tetratricopeptide (TPR) repeat protein n=1 Tax=Rheinheimera soli TaxID=443616 RepID=A0ABU1W4T3_9GAMM|nr:tetratricopeptide repeat protein [Rheinheimera soli]MDR7122964.1 tetratricopeptide (TPR) repeat protein [Rheinheimera soli]
MRKSKLISSIIAFVGTLISSQAHSIVQEHQLVAGDVLVKKEILWKTVKILEVDKSENNQVTLHAVFFEESKEKPSLSNLNNVLIKIHHAPVDADGFKQSWELLGNSTVTNNELEGFFEYLKQTDFQRYAEVTNQNVDDLISAANAKYKEAYSFSQQSKFNEAIKLYSEAVDLFPMFVEAIDNIAFAYMDIGDNEAAIKYFDKSLNIEPNNFTALYYKGHCFINLRDRDAAIAVFEDGMTRFPEKKAAFEEMYLKLKNMRSNG